MPPANITFRNHLLGSVSDFSDECGMPEIITPPILVEIIVSLSHYEEEGIKLFPEVYICEDLEQILQLLPGNGKLSIGDLPLSVESVKKILKKCAPLATEGWNIFLEGRGGRIRFGMFRDSLGPTTVPIDEVLLSNDGNNVKVVHVHQVAIDCVEIKNFLGSYYNIYLSHKKETAEEPGKYLSALVDSICENVCATAKEPVKTYLKKALKRGLRASHGALIAVCRSRYVPKFLDDGTKLIPPLDFQQLIITDDPMKISTLIASSSLLMGMLSSDGIVIFSNDAKLLAYNCFVTTSSKAKGRNVAGGARRRAYDALCDKLGKGTYAAFIQSQDGWMEFKRVENADH